MPSSSYAPDKEALSAGDVISALFPLHVPGGREQQGYRPAVVVGIPERLGVPRFEVLIVVPLTTDRGQAWSERSPALYPRLERSAATLRSPSICLLDQVRAIGAERVRGYRGTLDAEQYRPIHEGLRKMMSCDARRRRLSTITSPRSEGRSGVYTPEHRSLIYSVCGYALEHKGI